MKIGLAAAFAAWLVSDDLLVAASIAVLAGIWTFLEAEEGPPVVPLAITLHWVQVTVGVFYVALTGRELEATVHSDYRPMVWMGLGCVVALVAGLRAGMMLVRRLKPVEGARPEYALTFKTLVLSYVAGTAVIGAVTRLAWEIPSLTQPIIALSYMRLGLLYLILRALVRASRWSLVAGLLAVEVVLGITGFYAGFREPLIMAALALLEIFDRRSVRHWATAMVLAGLMAMLGIVWVSVRGDYRERFLADETFAASRSERISSLSEAFSGWASRDAYQLGADVDRFVERMWVVYYPSLAVARVPALVPHTGGELMKNALIHVLMPRLFFPDKPNLDSDSELVRRYAGVFVAGEREGTSIAFGYAAESYVDFGVPLMFVPVFLYGVFMGLCYSGLLRILRHRDLAISIVTIICWLTLYLFERSWVKTLGLAGTMLIYVGGLGLLLDRLWFEKYRALHGGTDAAPEPAAHLQDRLA
jgi:hypothetical protein